MIHTRTKLLAIFLLLLPFTVVAKASYEQLTKDLSSVAATQHGIVDEYIQLLHRAGPPNKELNRHELELFVQDLIAHATDDVRDRMAKELEAGIVSAVKTEEQLERASQLHVLEAVEQELHMMMAERGGSIVHPLHAQVERRLRELRRDTSRWGKVKRFVKSPFFILPATSVVALVAALAAVRYFKTPEGWSKKDDDNGGGKSNGGNGGVVKPDPVDPQPGGEPIVEPERPRAPAPTPGGGADIDDPDVLRAIEESLKDRGALTDEQKVALALEQSRMAYEEQQRREEEERERQEKKEEEKLAEGIIENIEKLGRGDGDGGSKSQAEQIRAEKKKEFEEKQRRLEQEQKQEEEREKQEREKEEGGVKAGYHTSLLGLDLMTDGLSDASSGLQNAAVGLLKKGDRTSVERRASDEVQIPEGVRKVFQALLNWHSGVIKKNEDRMYNARNEYKLAIDSLKEKEKEEQQRLAEEEEREQQRLAKEKEQELKERDEAFKKRFRAFKTTVEKEMLRDGYEVRDEKDVNLDYIRKFEWHRASREDDSKVSGKVEAFVIDKFALIEELYEEYFEEEIEKEQSQLQQRKMRVYKMDLRKPQ